MNNFTTLFSHVCTATVFRKGGKYTQQVIITQAMNEINRKMCECTWWGWKMSGRRGVKWISGWWEVNVRMRLCTVKREKVLPVDFQQLSHETFYDPPFSSAQRGGKSTRKQWKFIKQSTRMFWNKLWDDDQKRWALDDDDGFNMCINAIDCALAHTNRFALTA